MAYGVGRGVGGARVGWSSADWFPLCWVGADADELPAYRPPLGEGKGGPPAYVRGQGQGQDEVALEPIQGELPRSDQPTEAEEGTEGQPEGEEPSGERASVAAPAPVHVA